MYGRWTWKNKINLLKLTQKKSKKKKIQKLKMVEIPIEQFWFFFSLARAFQFLLA